MDEIIKKAIAREFIQKPSSTFSDKVMTQIFMQPLKIKVTPLISSRGWIFVALFPVIILIGLFQTSDTETVATIKVNQIISNSTEVLSHWIDQFVGELGTIQNLVIILVVMLSIFILLGLDYLLNSRKA